MHRCMGDGITVHTCIYLSLLLDELSIDETDSDCFISRFVVCSSSDSPYNPTDTKTTKTRVVMMESYTRRHPYITFLRCSIGSLLVLVFHRYNFCFSAATPTF